MSNPAPAPSYVRPSKAEDWEPYRHIIAELYRTKKLKEVIEEMEAVYYFKATQVFLLLLPLSVPSSRPPCLLSQTSQLGAKGPNN